MPLFYAGVPQSQLRRAWSHPMTMPYEDPILPVSSSKEPEFAPEQKRLFRHVLELLNRNGVPYVVSGAFARHTHTGIWRDTNDLDLFLTGENAERALQLLHQGGFA